jgi:hypothetical protein
MLSRGRSSSEIAEVLAPPGSASYDPKLSFRCTPSAFLQANAEGAEQITPFGRHRIRPDRRGRKMKAIIFSVNALNKTN